MVVDSVGWCGVVMYFTCRMVPAIRWWALFWARPPSVYVLILAPLVSTGDGPCFLRVVMACMQALLASVREGPSFDGVMSPSSCHFWQQLSAWLYHNLYSCLTCASPVPLWASLVLFSADLLAFRLEEGPLRLSVTSLWRLHAGACSCSCAVLNAHTTLQVLLLSRAFML